MYNCNITSYVLWITGLVCSVVSGTWFGWFLYKRAATYKKRENRVKKLLRDHHRTGTTNQVEGETAGGSVTQYILDEHVPGAIGYFDRMVIGMWSLVWINVCLWVKMAVIDTCQPDTVLMMLSTSIAWCLLTFNIFMWRTFVVSMLLRTSQAMSERCENILSSLLVLSVFCEVVFPQVIVVFNLDWPSWWTVMTAGNTILLASIVLYMTRRILKGNALTGEMEVYAAVRNGLYGLCVIFGVLILPHVIPILLVFSCPVLTAFNLSSIGPLANLFSVLLNSLIAYVSTIFNMERIVKNQDTSLGLHPRSTDDDTNAVQVMLC